jgi:Flp pilus assembly protein TadG
MTDLLLKFWRSGIATAAVEFAFIVPVMLLMVAGITEYGRYYVVSDAANRLATQYASAWADCSDVPTGTCALELNTFGSSNVIQNIVPPLAASKTTLSMFQVIMVGTTPTVVSSYPAASTLSSAQSTAASAILTSGESGVVVTVTYAHSLDYFPGIMSAFLGSALNISNTVVQLKS